MSEIAPPCPKCGKTNVGSNHYEGYNAARNFAHHLGPSGNPWVMGFAGGMWLVQQGLNLLSERWVCGDCGHVFTPKTAEELAAEAKGIAKESGAESQGAEGATPSGGDSSAEMEAIVDAEPIPDDAAREESKSSRAHRSQN